MEAGIESDRAVEEMESVAVLLVQITSDRMGEVSQSSGR